MKIYIVPEVVSSKINTGNMYSPLSMGETVVGSVVGSVVGAIVTDMIPGPAIPG